MSTVISSGGYWVTDLLCMIAEHSHKRGDRDSNIGGKCEHRVKVRTARYTSHYQHALRRSLRTDDKEKPIYTRSLLSDERIASATNVRSDT
jgi:hypothetical protein